MTAYNSHSGEFVLHLPWMVTALSPNGLDLGPNPSGRRLLLNDELTGESGMAKRRTIRTPDSLWGETEPLAFFDHRVRVESKPHGR